MVELSISVLQWEDQRTFWKMCDFRRLTGNDALNRPSQVLRASILGSHCCIHEGHWSGVFLDND
jgi:hypothetical protein